MRRRPSCARPPTPAPRALSLVALGALCALAAGCDEATFVDVPDARPRGGATLDAAPATDADVPGGGTRVELGVSAPDAGDDAAPGETTDARHPSPADATDTADATSPPDGAAPTPPDAMPPPALPTAPPGPQEVTPQPAAEVTPERLAEGAFDFVAAPDAAHIVARGDAGLRVWTPLGLLTFESAPVFDAALAWDAHTVLLGGPEGLHVATDAVLEPSPLGASLRGAVVDLALDTPDPAAPADRGLWMATDAALFRWQAGALARVAIGELPTAGARLAPSPHGLWVAAGRTVYRLAAVNGALRAYVSAQDRPVGDLAADADDNLWIPEDGDLHQRTAAGRWTRWRLPSAVLQVAAHPASADVWLRTADGLWHTRDGQFRPIRGVPVFSAVACAPGGEAVLAGADALYRALPGRHVLLSPSFDPGAGPLAGAGVLEVVPAFPEHVVAVTARLDADAPASLDGPPWRLPLDGEALPETPHAVEVTVEWDDAAPVSARFEFRVDRPAPPPPPPPPTEPPAPPTEPPPPTFAGDVRPLFDAACGQCHGPRGFAHRLDGFARFTAEFDAILAVVTDGRMPLPPNPPLTPAQLTLLRAWRDAGFPE